VNRRNILLSSEFENRMLDNKKGIDLYNKGAYKEAVYWFTRALEKDPKSSKLWFNKGNACYKLAACKSSQEESYKAVEKEFKNAKLKIIPCEKGKNIITEESEK